MDLSPAPWALEPELRASAPRRVRRRAGRGSFIGFRQLMVLPFIVVSLMMLRLPLHQAAISLAGRMVTARVTGHTFLRDDKGRPEPALRYAYDFQGRHFERVTAIDRSHFLTPVGTRFSATVNPLDPGFAAELQLPGTEKLTLPLRAVFVLTGVVPLLLCAFVIRMGWLVPLRLRSLVVSGIPVEGELVKKGNANSFVLCRYCAPDGQNKERLFDIGSLAEMQPDGARYTVLCDPKKPERALLYPFADWEAVAPTGV